MKDKTKNIIKYNREKARLLRLKRKSQGWVSYQIMAPKELVDAMKKLWVEYRDAHTDLWEK